jgi:hypothetical protein
MHAVENVKGKIEEVKVRSKKVREEWLD